MQWAPVTRDELIRSLVDVWTEGFGVPVTPESDFFALGGTSLLAISIVDAIAERYARGVDGFELLALQLIFEEATLADMADKLYASLARPA